MKISNKKKFAIRIIEILIIIATIIITMVTINYTSKLRGYKAFGGEYLIPILGLLVILVIESIYEEGEKKNENRKQNKTRD